MSAQHIASPLPAVGWLGHPGPGLRQSHRQRPFPCSPSAVEGRKPTVRQAHRAQEGIVFKTASIDSTIEWKLYRELLSDNHTHLLVYGTNGFTAVPRRVFLSPEQDAGFVELVRSAIPPR